ncbi:MAG: DUF2946 family protein [Ferrovibrionaceae bacterium]
MYRRLAMLLALLALLLQSATVSAHGLMPVPQAGGETIALCTPYGVKLVRVDADGAPAVPQARGGDDCTLCLHAGAGAAVMPPPAALPVTLALTIDDSPIPVRAAIAPDYRTQSPRGPPEPR